MRKIMLVDDEAWCLEELTDFLTDIGGIKIIGRHSDPGEALASAQEEQPDIAFIDILMPGLNGLDLAQRMKQEMPGMKVVLISEDESYARQVFEIGGADFILKPIRRERVHQALERSG